MAIDPTQASQAGLSALTIGAISELRVDLAKLNGKIDLTNQRLDAVIKTLEDQKKNRKWLVTTAFSSIVTALALLSFLFR